MITALVVLAVAGDIMTAAILWLVLRIMQSRGGDAGAGS